MMDHVQIPDRRELAKKYEALIPVYESVLAEIFKKLKLSLDSHSFQPTIKYRVKSFASFYQKKMKFLKKAREEHKTRVLPVTDVLGIRLVCPFMEDLGRAEDIIANAFKVVELERKGADYSFKEFGYESTHVLIEIPEDVKKAHHNLDVAICEIQIRTILQDAWAEVEHELVYKADFSPFDQPMKRKLAALNANLTLSDIIFQEIRDYQHQLNTELAKRRSNFYDKVESSIDSGFFKEPKQVPHLEKYDHSFHPKGSIDEMLLEALYAHNHSDFKKAIDIYSAILDLGASDKVLSIIYKHRGMAYFAESRYDEAIADFEKTIEFDPKCYKSLYYSGVIHAVRKQYFEAIDAFTTAIGINPYHFYCHYRRAQAHYHLKDYPEALGDCDNALKLEPDSAEASKLKEIILKKLKM